MIVPRLVHAVAKRGTKRRRRCGRHGNQAVVIDYLESTSLETLRLNALISAAENGHGMAFLSAMIIISVVLPALTVQLIAALSSSAVSCAPLHARDDVTSTCFIIIIMIIIINFELSFSFSFLWYSLLICLVEGTPQRERAAELRIGCQLAGRHGASAAQLEP